MAESSAVASAVAVASQNDLKIQIWATNINLGSIPDSQLNAERCPAPTDYHTTLTQKRHYQTIAAEKFTFP